MKRKILLIFSVVTVCIVSIVAVFSATSISRIRGSFQPIVTWTGGHPWSIIFDIWSSNSWYNATRDQDGYLSWFFWLWNVGWSTFSQMDWSIPLCRPRVVCPDNILQNPNQLCPVHGCAWSQNAGWVILSGSMIDSASTWVYYNPSTALIEWWGWNRWLGWVPFYAKTVNQELWIDPLTSSGIFMDGVSLQFVWRIAIVGNIAGTRIFELPNQNVGYIYNFTNHASIMNAIRKNIALMTRNISDAILANVSSSFDFLVQKTGDYIFDYGAIWPVSKKTIIVIWHDVILDTENTIWMNDGNMRWLIVLKDSDGNGWNIIISDKVQQIYALVFAEGSLFSGVKTATWLIVPYVSRWAFNIPQNQLYIKWLLISKNTISWSRQNPPVCPVVVGNCTQSTAEIYDLNYFRTYDPLDPTQRAIPYSWSTLDTASVIVEYDNTILSNPPPWLQSLIQ